MKTRTRIRIEEYNSGKKEFICEEDDRMRYFDGLFSILFTFPSLVMLICGSWKPMLKRVSPKNETDFNKWEAAYFDNIDDAKKFIDSELEKRRLEKEHKERDEFLAKIKKTTYIKYP